MIRVLLALVMFAALARGQTGFSSFFGGLIFRQSTGENLWGNETTPGPRGMVNAPTMVWNPVQSYSVTAEVALSDPLTNACEFVNAATWSGKIVLMSLGGFCSHAEKALIAQQNGAVGVVWTELSAILPSWDSMASDPINTPQLTIPVNFIGQEVGRWMIGQIVAGFSSNVSLVATITYQQDSIYEWTLSPTFIFIQVGFSLWLGVCAIFSLVKLGLFIKEQNGLKFTVPQVCLFLCFVVSVWTIISLTLNFLGSRNSTSHLTMVILREFTAVFWLAPTLIFPFYWGELVASSQPVTGLKQSKIPFVVAIFIILGFSLAVFIVKGAYGSNRDVIWAQLITSTILGGLAAIFFTFQGLRVLISLSRMQDGFAATPIQRRTTVLFLVLAGCLWGFTVSYGYSFADGIGIAFPNFAMWWMSFYMYVAFSVAIMVFTLSPKTMKEAGARMSAFLSGTTSGMDSGASGASGADVEMAKKSSDENIDGQMKGTSVEL